MKEIKIRFVCQDLAGNIFYLFHSIDEFINGLNLARNGLIETIQSKDVFTLLHDSHGKEVYEGDRIIAKHGHVEYKGEVIFDEGSFCLRVMNSPEGYNKHPPDYDYGQTPELNNFDEIRIVGNCYEGCAEPVKNR